MSDRIKVNVPPWQGEYDLDMSEAFTALEWRWVKKISGYLPLTVDEALKGGDPDFIIALTAIALVRAGKIQKDQVFEVADALADAPFDGAAISVIVDSAGQSPPAPDSSESSNESETSGGADSEPTSESPGNGQSRTGLHALRRSATSDRQTSVT